MCLLVVKVLTTNGISRKKIRSNISTNNVKAKLIVNGYCSYNKDGEHLKWVNKTNPSSLG